MNQDQAVLDEVYICIFVWFKFQSFAYLSQRKFFLCPDFILARSNFAACYTFAEIYTIAIVIDGSLLSWLGEIVFRLVGSRGWVHKLSQFF